MNEKKLTVILSAVTAFIFIGFIVLSIAIGYLYLNQQGDSGKASARIMPGMQVKAQASPTPESEGIPFFSEVFQESAPDPNASWGERIISIIIRLFIAVFLATILAFRPRKNIPFFQRNIYVAQTQILLAVVAAALMMIVGDSAARAFAIFAAASLVRFRTNIRDPKEITVLLISLALGMAAGVGRWDLGLVLCIFALILLWFLEQQESEQVFRQMELTVKTRNTDRTQVVLKKIFRKYNLEAEVRELDQSDEENPVGSITYYVNLRFNLSTDYLSKQVFALDPKNVEGITWKHKKEKFAG